MSRRHWGQSLSKQHGETLLFLSLKPDRQLQHRFQLNAQQALQTLRIIPLHYSTKHGNCEPCLQNLLLVFSSLSSMQPVLNPLNKPIFAYQMSNKTYNWIFMRDTGGRFCCVTQWYTVGRFCCVRSQRTQQNRPPCIRQPNNSQ